MRFRLLLPAILGVCVLFVPLAASAAIPFFGPIIPQDANQNICPASWGMLITVINNIISFLITLAIVFVAPLTIAWAGFLFVVNPVDPGGIAKARGILRNTVVGIVLALAAWLIVNAVMAVLYKPAAFGKTWSELITSGGIAPCLSQAGALPGGRLNQAPVTGISAGGSPQIGRAPGPCSPGNTACSVDAIQLAAQELSLTLSDAQKTVMSCIAMTESGGNPSTPDSRTGACGTFQITNRPGNWANPAFHRSPCSTTSSCNDARCNLQTALIMFSQQKYQPWAGKNPDGTYWNANAVACVKQYDPVAGNNI